MFYNLSGVFTWSITFNAKTTFQCIYHFKLIEYIKWKKKISVFAHSITKAWKSFSKHSSDRLLLVSKPNLNEISFMISSLIFTKIILPITLCILILEHLCHHWLYFTSSFLPDIEHLKFRDYILFSFISSFQSKFLVQIRCLISFSKQLKYWVN